jgi:metal-responsive CopG/Arc/MetJ family transcriptional regulator
MKDTEVRMTVRLPVDVVEFLDNEAERDFMSRNAAIVRSLREWIDRQKREGPAAPTTSPSEATK